MKKEQKFKLFRLFSTFSNVEVKAFGRFLKCGYFTKDLQLVKFYDYLKKFAPDFDNSKLEKIALAKKFFPKQENAQKKITDLMFHFSAQLERFLLIKEVEDESQRKKLLQTVYFNRELTKDFDALIDQQINQLEAIPYKEVTDFQQLMNLHYQKYYQVGFSSIKMNVENLKKASINLDCFFMLNKLTLGSEILNRGLIFREKADRISLTDLENLSLYFQEDSNILIQLYTYIPTLYRSSKGDFAFFELKKLFITNIDKISIDEQQNIHLHLLNFAIRRGNDKYSFFEETLELYKLAIEHEILLVNNQILGNRFINIVNIACHVEELNWAENFIKKYNIYLIKKNKENTISMTFAMLRFHQKKYTDAIQYLLFTEFTNSIYAIRGKFLEIKCYFELFLEDESYHQVLITKLDTFYRFTQRGREMSEYKRKLFGNCTQIIRQLVKWKMNRSQQNNKNGIIKYIESKKPYVATKWIQEKIEKL